MFVSKIEEISTSIKHLTGLSIDALLIYLGLILYFIIAAIDKRQLKSNIALTVTFLIALTLEIFNSRVDIFGRGYWRVGASIHNIVLMIFLPYVLWAMAKFRIWKG